MVAVGGWQQKILFVAAIQQSPQKPINFANPLWVRLQMIFSFSYNSVLSIRVSTKSTHFLSSLDAITTNTLLPYTTKICSGFFSVVPLDPPVKPFVFSFFPFLSQGFHQTDFFPLSSCHHHHWGDIVSFYYSNSRISAPQCYWLCP